MEKLIGNLESQFIYLKMLICKIVNMRFKSKNLAKIFMNLMVIFIWITNKSI